MTPVELLGLSAHLADCRAKGMRGTLWREVEKYVEAVEQAKRGEGQQAQHDATEVRP